MSDDVIIICKNCQKETNWDDDGLCESCGLKEYLAQVGCRKCGVGGKWHVYVNEHEEFEAFMCGNCNHKVGFPLELKTEIDERKDNIFDMRFFT